MSSNEIDGKLTRTIGYVVLSQYKCARSLDRQRQVLNLCFSVRMHLNEPRLALAGSSQVVSLETANSHAPIGNVPDNRVVQARDYFGPS